MKWTETLRRATIAGATIIFAAALFMPASFSQTRYFRVCSGVCGSSPDDFTIALDDTKQLQAADDILNGRVTDQVHVQGFIIAQPAFYNAPWQFYLDPKSISFFTLGHTTCWGYSTTEVNAKLTSVGSPGFLPTRFWCPRGYKLSQEVK